MPWEFDVTIFALIIAIVVLVICSDYFKRGADGRVQSGVAMDAFYQSANALTEDDRTPLFILEMLSEMSKDLTDASIMRRLVYAALSGKSRNLPPEQIKHQKEFHDAISEMPVELQRHFFRASSAALYSISYHSVYYGALFRRLMMLGAEYAKRSRDQDRDTRVEKYAVRMFKDNHDHNDGCAAPA